MTGTSCLSHHPWCWMKGLNVITWSPAFRRAPQSYHLEHRVLTGSPVVSFWIESFRCSSLLFEIINICIYTNTVYQKCSPPFSKQLTPRCIHWLLQWSPVPSGISKKVATAAQEISGHSEAVSLPGLSSYSCLLSTWAWLVVTALQLSGLGCGCPF